MLVTSIFSFSHSVSTLSKGEIVILEMFNLLSANALNLVMIKVSLFGKGLVPMLVLEIIIIVESTRGAGPGESSVFLYK